MKTIFTLITLLFGIFITNSQNDTIYKDFSNSDDLNSQTKQENLEKLFFVDSTLNYRAEVPKWLTLTRTGDDNIWGGTFPKVNNIQNALMIKGFSKDEFDSFEHFKEVFITGNKFGKKTLFSENHTWYGYNERDLKTTENGVSCRVFTIFRNKVYHNNFVLLETKTAFIWIQFVSTPETYDKNIDKFERFISSVKVLN